MSNDLHVKVSDCSWEKLTRIARQCGFIIKEGRKHSKIKTADGVFITIVPRHNRLKRETAKKIVDAFNSFGGNVSYS